MWTCDCGGTTGPPPVEIGGFGNKHHTSRACGSRGPDGGTAKAADAERARMSYAKVNLGDVEPRDVEGLEPALRAVGYELRPSKMRPSVWEFEAGDANNRHRQAEQEELYVVLEGRLRMEVDGEAFDVTAGDYVVVPPESWRQLVAETGSLVLVVGAPNVSDDGILEEGVEKADGGNA